MGVLGLVLALVLRRFVYGENPLNNVKEIGLTKSIYATLQGYASTKKYSFAEAIKSNFSNTTWTNILQN